MKDWWDKFEIVGKAIGAIVIPVVVGGTALFLNSQISARDQSARMSQIAVGILSDSASDANSSPLRDWAIDILRNPQSPPPLSEEAAAALKSIRLFEMGAIWQGPSMSVWDQDNFSYDIQECVDVWSDLISDANTHCTIFRLLGTYPLSTLQAPQESSPSDE